MSAVFTNYVDLVLKMKSQVEVNILVRQYMLKEEEDEREREAIRREIEELEQEVKEHEEVLYFLFTKRGDTQEVPAEKATLECR